MFSVESDAGKMLAEGFYNTDPIARVTYLKQGELRRGNVEACSDAVMLKVFIRLAQNPHSIQLQNLFRFTDCNFCHVAVMDN